MHFGYLFLWGRGKWGVAGIGAYLLSLSTGWTFNLINTVVALKEMLGAIILIICIPSSRTLGGTLWCIPTDSSTIDCMHENRCIPSARIYAHIDISQHCRSLSRKMVALQYICHCLVFVKFQLLNNS